MATLPSMKKIANGFTIRITFPQMNQWLWRLKIGVWLIRLAAWVMWMNVEVNAELD